MTTKRTVTVHVDKNHRTTVPGLLPGTYVATLNQDGSALIEPAQTLTNSQVAQLSKPLRSTLTPAEIEARKATVRALVQADPHLTGTQVLQALRDAGYTLEIRTAYNDINDAREALRLPPTATQ